MSIQSSTVGHRVFMIANAAFLILIAVVCFVPFLHVLALSFSSRQAVETGLVTLWPVQPTLRSYAFIAEKPVFMKSLLISVERVLLGSAVNMVLTCLVAYPLSKTTSAFRWRSVYLWFFLVTMLFGGGMIPLYMVVVKTRLIDSIWSLVLPSAVPVFNVILLVNFFRDLPRELEEAAYIDGAGHWRTLWQVLIPLSLPAIATLTLFVVVFHWNSWFDGLIYMRTPERQPLQTYIAGLVRSRSIIGGRRLSLQELRNMAAISEHTTQAAQILLASLPIILVYPLLQRYFVKGIMLGSVKG
jgi:putative aldouronate transport system permease protein